jgi:hypothetical protein
MQKYKSNITTTSGAAVRGVPVLVIDEDGNNAALFLDRAGTVPAQNPLTTGPDGVFYFYAVNGRYSLRATVDGVSITDSDVVMLMDPEEITVAGPIAEAVAAAKAAALRAETAVEDSGIPLLVAAAQNAVVDANHATDQAVAAAALADTAKNAAAMSEINTAISEGNALTSKAAAAALAESASAKASEAAASAVSAAASAESIAGGPVASVNGKTGVVAIAKADVGLGNVDNTSDANKPISTAQQNELNLKANLASPALTGTPTAPTATEGTSTTQLATTAFAKAEAALRYGKDNVIGTVSQSAGVPTGALIEYGSNANGEYCRYADGTQICWSSKIVSGLSFTAGTGVRYASIPNLTFPSTFSINPTVHYTASNSDVATLSAYVAGYSVSTTGIASGLLAAPGGTTGTGAAATIIKMVALGRWY